MANSFTGYTEPSSPTKKLATRLNATGEHVQKVVPEHPGTWGYSGGSSGTVTLTGTKRVTSVGCHASSGGATVAINGGNAVPVPSGNSVSLSIDGELIDPSIVFTGTDSYFVQFVSS